MGEMKDHLEGMNDNSVSLRGLYSVCNQGKIDTKKKALNLLLVGDLAFEWEKNGARLERLNTA